MKERGAMKSILRMTGEGVFLGLLALLVFLMFVIGCASAPAPVPEVVTKPEPVDKLVVVKGDPLPVCRAYLERCDQETDLEKIRCVGRNAQALMVCHERNVGTIDSHNKAIE
jgi:hypothetical protein